MPLGVVRAVQTSSENSEENPGLLETQPSSHAIKGARSSPGTRLLNPSRGVPSAAPQHPGERDGAVTRSGVWSPRTRATHTRESEPLKIPGRAQRGEREPNPPASALVPRSHTADPAAPRSIPPAPTVSEAPYGRISLSLFLAGDVVVAVAPARQRPLWPLAPNLPLRSPSRCWIPGCRLCYHGDSGRRRAHRRHRHRRPPRHRQSPPTCPRVPEPESGPEKGRASAPRRYHRGPGSRIRGPAPAPRVWPLDPGGGRREEGGQ